MGTTPVLINPGAAQADAIIKQWEGILVPIAEAAIVAAVPELGDIIIKQITDAIEQALADKITVLLEDAANNLVFIGQVSTEESALTVAEAALVAAQKSGDPNAIAAAEQALALASSSLDHFDGASPPQ